MDSLFDASKAGSGVAIHEQVETVAQRLKEEAKERTRVARVLAPLAKPEAYQDLKKLKARLKKAQESLSGETLTRCRLERLFKGLNDFAGHAGERLRQELARELKKACESAGLELKVITREEPVEVRIPPLSVVLDFASGRADLRFARQTLRSCPAKAGDILASYKAALKALNYPFKPQEFFDRCLAAYRAALASARQREGDRVELNEFLPLLAIQTQPKKFRVDPVAQNYKPYSRAQLAFDVLRLKQAKGLSRGGMRINFGVATGTTASSKNRALYMEDAYGNGEFKLTVFFTKPKE